jgi:hypothetical protein
LYKLIFLSLTVIIISLSSNASANAISFLEGQELVASKDDIIKTEKEANANGQSLGKIFDTCKEKFASGIFDYIQSCVSFLEKFNYHINQLWNDTKKQVDEIGK